MKMGNLPKGLAMSGATRIQKNWDRFPAKSSRCRYGTRGIQRTLDAFLFLYIIL